MVIEEVDKEEGEGEEVLQEEVEVMQEEGGNTRIIGIKTTETKTLGIKMVIEGILVHDPLMTDDRDRKNILMDMEREQEPREEETGNLSPEKDNSHLRKIRRLPQ